MAEPSITITYTDLWGLLNLHFHQFTQPSPSTEIQTTQEKSVLIPHPVTVVPFSSRPRTELYHCLFFPLVATPLISLDAWTEKHLPDGQPSAAFSQIYQREIWKHCIILTGNPASKLLQITRSLLAYKVYFLRHPQLGPFLHCLLNKSSLSNQLQWVSKKANYPSTIPQHQLLCYMSIQVMLRKRPELQPNSINLWLLVKQGKRTAL